MRWPSFRSRYTLLLESEKARLQREVEATRQRGDTESSRLRSRVKELEGKVSELEAKLIERDEDILYHMARVANLPLTPNQVERARNIRSKKTVADQDNPLRFREKQLERQKKASKVADEMLRTGTLPIIVSRADIAKREMYEREAALAGQNGAVNGA